MQLQSFAAHHGSVQCATFGTKGSAGSRLLATGGGDQLVNVWSVGTQAAVCSLQGCSSGVSSLVFGPGEERILAGAEKGTLKLFDVDGAKAVRSITGHRGAVTAVDIHMSRSHFMASGSSDTNCKLWDSRARDCVAKYVGHSGALNTLAFSPDGQWLASGSADGMVKVRLSAV